MSAPVPLSSGCCAPPCPTSPTSAVPGPAGENAFSLTTATFTQPVVGGNVLVSLSHDGWVVQGQTVFVQGGGFYQVVTVSGLNATLNNLGSTGNAGPGVLIFSGAKVSPGGVGGSVGNAFTTTSAGYTQPAVGANVTVQVVLSSWAAVGEVVFVATGGYYTVFSVPDGTHLTLTNLGYPGNAAPTAVINSPQQVTPGGVRGAAGAPGVSTLNSVSPTTTKGDLIVDNGANNPLASDVRLGVGTNGKAVVADSTQPTGLNYTTITPNTVATSGDIAVFSGTSGTPMPLADSKLLITTDGAVQSTPSGGNARGTKATDLQVDRAVATQVAGGNNSVVAGGQNNTASGIGSGVSSGRGNTASGTDSSVSGGNGNVATNTQDTVGGGLTNTAAGGASTVAGGSGNVAGFQGFIGGGIGNSITGTAGVVAGGSANASNGFKSVIGGGDSNTTSLDFACIPGGSQAVAPLYGELSHASGQFANPGDAQVNELIWRMVTTDATGGVEMFLDGGTIPRRAVVGLNNTWAFLVRLVGRSSAGVCAVWETKGGIQNVAGTVTLIAANTQTVVVDGTGGTWGVTANFAITADNTNKSLKLAVTGAVATTIRWVAHARLVQVGF